MYIPGPVLHQPPPHHPYVEPSVTTNGEVLNAVDKFTYLGSVLSRDVHIDNEIDTLPKLAQCLGGSKERFGRED